MQSIFKRTFHTLLCCFVSMFALAGHAAPQGDTVRYTDSGKLQAVEQNGIIQIDDKRYRLDHHVLVVDEEERPLSIQKLNLPTQVLFEYSYQLQNTKVMAPHIVYIKENKETRGVRRSEGSAR